MSKISSIGIFALSSALKPGEDVFFESAVKQLSDWGLKVFRADNLYHREELFTGAGMWLAGSASERTENFLKLWSNPQVDLMISLRGGYGCAETLDLMDFEYFTKNPKPIIGYSDLTNLIIALSQKSYTNKRHQLFHAPMIIELTRLDSEQISAYIKLLSSVDPDLYRAGHLDLGPAFNGTHKKILGGNLSLINSLIGTEFQLSTKPEILFLEECYEEAYKVDRYARQLERAGYFDNISELWLGEGLETLYNLQYFEKLSSQKSFLLRHSVPHGHKTKFPLVLN